MTVPQITYTRAELCELHEKNYGDNDHAVMNDKGQYLHTCFISYKWSNEPFYMPKRIADLWSTMYGTRVVPKEPSND